MANLSKARNVVQEKYILYDVTGFTQKWHSIPVATNCTQVPAQTPPHESAGNSNRAGRGSPSEEPVPESKQGGC